MVKSFLFGFGLRSASGNSGAQAERRLERSRSATPPLTADGSPPQLRSIHRHRDGRGFCGMKRASSRGGQGRRADRGKEQCPRWSRRLARCPRWRNGLIMGRRRNLENTGANKFSIFFDSIHLAQRRNSPPKIRLARDVYAAKVKPAKRCEIKLTRERRWASRIFTVSRRSPVAGELMRGSFCEGEKCGRMLLTGHLFTVSE